MDYAADLPTHKIKSFFKNGEDASFNYTHSSFNLNNLAGLDGTLTKSAFSKMQVSGVTQPWLYIGMKFASFCWHVQDLYLHSVNFNHQGQTKTWYVIPASHRQVFEQLVRKKVRDELHSGIDYLAKITLMVDPKEIVGWGIPVRRARQAQGTYVVTFPQAYHAGFSHGFNICEAVNFIPQTSLPHILRADSIYRTSKRIPVFPAEWLLLSNAGMEKAIRPYLKTWLQKAQHLSL